MPFIRFLFLLTLFVFSAMANVDTLNVAVLNLDGVGISESEAIIITERLREELMIVKSFTILEREEMESILEEQVLQQTGCTSSECAVKVGQLLSVEQIIVGSVSKFENMYTLQLRMLDIETGEVRFNISEDCFTGKQDLLIKSTKSIAGKIKQKVEMAPYGGLEIRTEPRQASVVLNGKKLGVTNYLYSRFTPGKYDLSLELQNYTPIKKKIEIVKGDTVSLSYTMELTQEYRDSVAAAEQAVKDSIAKEKRRARIKKKIVRQAVIGAFGIATGAAGAYYNGKADNAISRQATYKTAYLNAGQGADFTTLYTRYENEGKTVDSNIRKRNVFYGIAGAATVTFSVTIFF